uniref:Uncharacterized protein n=1 Tax=Physcomitrium patens TaxID=3218 RepID=A0A7I4CR15_PHYPA
MYAEGGSVFGNCWYCAGLFNNQPIFINVPLAAC